MSTRSYRSLSLLLALSLFAVSAVSNAETTSPAYTIQNLLEDASLILEAPEGFVSQAPERNAILDYEYALKHGQKKLAVRYAIRPIAMVSIDYEDPHNAAPEPNHLYPILFQSLISALSSGGRSPSTEYSQIDARSKFNADWAAAAVMDVTPDFSTEYSQLLLLALHGNHASDAYVMILFDDYAAVKPEINLVLGSLKFR